MSDSRTNTPIPALDFVLVMAAAAAIITLGFTGAHSATVVVMAVTIIYVILSTLLTGADLPSAAGRGYLLCFLTSLVTLVAGMGSLSTQLNSLQVDPTDPQAAQRLLIDTACQLVPNLLMPLGLGVIIYAASSVFEAKSTVAQNTETARQQASEHLLKITPSGSTNTERALEIAAAWKPTTIILFTDGAPTDEKGEIDHQQQQRIISRLKATTNPIPINVIAMSNYYNEELSSFLHGIAGNTGGGFVGL